VLGGELAPGEWVGQDVGMAKTKAKKPSRKEVSSKASQNIREVISHAEELLHATTGVLGEKAREVRHQLVRKLEAAKE